MGEEAGLWWKEGLPLVEVDTPGTHNFVRLFA